MGCVNPQTEAKVIHDFKTCFMCRHDCPNAVPFKTGVNYEKCSLVIIPEKFAPVEPLTNLREQCDLIYGVVTCSLDATEVDEATASKCKLAVLAGKVKLDPNLICWPEGTAEEDIQWLVDTAKCCIEFGNRFECSEVPSQLLDRLQTKGTIKELADAKQVTRVPLEKSSKQDAPKPDAKNEGGKK